MAVGSLLVPFPSGHLEDLAARALAEDLGGGDVTSRAVIPTGLAGRGIIRAGEPLVLAGTAIAAAVLERADPALRVTFAHADGARLPGGEIVAEIEGNCRSILAAERTALNFLQHLSGIATLAARAVAAIRGSGATLLDTRKTTPGLRLLEKAAARAGGMQSHRSGLDDGVLIKDNHVALCGSAAEAVSRARAAWPRPRTVEVELDTLDELDAVIEAGADIVLLDNLPPEQLSRAVRLADDRVVLEASGGITLDSLPAYAASGVHRISVGFVTHSAPAVGLSLELGPGDADRAH
jgi:nicotinate-nucleotide pyrophosphorylase (carboxylating)